MNKVITGTVTKIVDGDTVHVLVTETSVEQFFEVKITTTKETERIIRLRGVDTPERGQVNYSEAKEFTRTACMGKEVELTIVGVDKYDRELAFVKLPDGSDLGQKLVANGLARLWVD